MSKEKSVKIAILDDYQGVALQMADWSGVAEKAEIVVFKDHLSDPKAVIERLKDFEVLCIMRERTPLPRSILEKLPNLKFISSPGRRNASLDLSAAVEFGVVVSNTGYAGHGAMEHTWALILAIVRNIPSEWDSVRKGKWQHSVGGELHGKTLGIAGLGNIGSTIARIAKAFEMRVIAWSENLTREKAAEKGAELVSKEELFRLSDIITLHLVLSPRTRGIVGAAELRLMKPSSYLINTSRGPLVDEKALIEVLKAKKIAGAALDVYDIEPLPAAHPFRHLDNVLATPHIGFVTEETYKVFYRDTVENIEAWMKGKPIRIMES